eukprot:IDg20775t1
MYNKRNVISPNGAPLSAKCRKIFAISFSNSTGSAHGRPHFSYYPPALLAFTYKSNTAAFFRSFSHPQQLARCSLCCERDPLHWKNGAASKGQHCGSKKDRTRERKKSRTEAECETGAIITALTSAEEGSLGRESPTR